MSVNVDNKSLLKFLVAIVLIVLALLVLIIVKQVETSGNIKTLIEENIAKTNWPVEIPIIKKNDIKIVKNVVSGDSNKVSWVIEMHDGVSYVDFRDYLIELEEAGFEPVKSLGSKSPRLLVTNPIIDEDFYLFWYGDFKEYRIEVYWANLMGYEPEELGPLDYNFTISLSKGIYNNEPNDSGDSEIIESGDFNSSGDVVSETIFSGDPIATSGDVNSGDLINEIIPSGEVIESGEVTE